MEIDALIFDCDGTLVDSEEIGLAAIVAAAQEIGAEFESADELLRLKGSPMSQCLRIVEERLGKPLPSAFESTVRRRMSEVFRTSLKPMPGAADMLRQLRVPFCIASNGPRQKIELTLGIAGLLPLLEGRLFSAYEVGYWKPEPELFLHAASAMGVAAHRCAVVEDSESGVRAALAAGMTVYLLRSAHSLPLELEARVKYIDQLPELVDEPWNRAR